MWASRGRVEMHFWIRWIRDVGIGRDEIKAWHSCCL